MVLTRLFTCVAAACLLASCQLAAVAPSAPQPPAGQPGPVSIQTAESAAQPLIFPTVTDSPTSRPAPTATLAPSRTPNATPTATPYVVGVMNLPADINPLTGLKVSDPSKLERRPVMVKIANYPRSGRPHSGLSFADLVFEYYIGEYASRFAAVFYSQDAEKAGPLRSGRMVDADLASLYQAVLVYGNADPRVDKVLVDTLGSLAVTFDDAPCPPICGLDTHSTAGVYADTSAMNSYMLSKGISNPRPNLGGMVFDERVPFGGRAAEQLAVMFGPQDRGEWRYDPSSQNYLRWIEDIRSNGQMVMIPLPDRQTGQQLAFSNVVVIYATYVEYLPTMHEILISQNVEPGRAFLFRDGVMVKGTWNVSAQNRPLRFTNELGLPITFKPGNTWIVIVGQGSDLFESQEGKWELEYHTK